MKTLALILPLLVACSSAIHPSVDLGHSMSDGGVSDSDSGGFPCPATEAECRRMFFCVDVCHYDDAGMLADAGADADVTDAGIDGGGSDAGTDSGTTGLCTSLADGCAGMFEFPANDGSDILHMATPPYFGAVGDYIESTPHVVPAVLVARHLDLTDLYVAPAGGASPCGPPPEFRVLVNGVEVGRFTPSYTTDFAEHFDFPDIAGTVFTVRIEETTPWCANTLRVVGGSRWGAYAALGAP